MKRLPIKVRQLSQTSLALNTATQLTTTNKLVAQATFYGVKAVAVDGAPTPNVGQAYLCFADDAASCRFLRPIPASGITFAAGDGNAINLANVWVLADTADDGVFCEYEDITGRR